MKLLEYQGKEVFHRYGIPVEKCHVLKSVSELKNMPDDLGYPVVVKAQVHVGGRGKAGGVKLAHNHEEMETYFKEIMGMTIKGEKVEIVCVTQAVNIEKEFYLSIVLDRENNGFTLMASGEGGMEIEQVAKESPEKILFLHINPLIGLLPYHAREVGFFLNIPKENISALSKIILKLYTLFRENDLTLAEINPLVITPKGDFYAIDSKMIIDDNAMIRHKDWEAYRTLSGDEKIEHEAKEKGLSYIKLDGNVGCIVNGAGLAMATMDLIKKYGGNPANFLDVGGSSRPQKMIDAIEIITRDKNVKSIFINIFGGITRCDDIAKGLLQAIKKINIELPIVIRLTGTNEKEGKALLEGTSLHTVSSMKEGAQLSIKLAKGV